MNKQSIKNNNTKKILIWVILFHPNQYGNKYYITSSHVVQCEKQNIFKVLQLHKIFCIVSIYHTVLMRRQNGSQEKRNCVLILKNFPILQYAMTSSKNVTA